MLQLPQSNPAQQVPVMSTAGKAPARSEIIDACVTYIQATTAYHAGFKADPTGNFDHAGAHTKLGKGHLRKASRALARLVELAGIGAPLTSAEMRAKAAVLRMMVDAGGTFNPEPDEEDYVRLFAGEIVEFMAGAHGQSSL